MRAAVALLALALLSGCLAEPAPSDAQASGDGRASTQAADLPQPTRFGVELTNQPYQATPDGPTSLQVNVPEGAVNVAFRLGTKVSVPAGTAATISLDGCGLANVSWGSVGVAGGNNWQEGYLCAAAESGQRQLTIEASLVPLAGDVVVLADLP